jgi:LysR family nitrogen assimilation transcriptional regulator
LARLPLILPSEQHWIYRRLSHAAFQHGISLRPKLRVQGLASLKPMLRSGLGCTVLPLSAVQEEVTRGSLVFRRIEQPTLTCTHAIAWSDAADAPVAAFAGLVRQAIEELAMRGAWVGADLLSAAAAPVPQPWTLPAADAARLEAVPA